MLKRFPHVFSCNRFQVRNFCVRVRFAPSPTGQLHLGGLRTALYNYLFAKRHNGQFLIRIEDTDQTRTVEGCEEKIISDCKWMGIETTEKIYKQSENLTNYKQYAEQLIKEGYAYRCFCTSERLEKMREINKNKGKQVTYDRKCFHLSSDQIQKNLDQNISFTIRLKIPRNEQLIVTDMVYETIKFDCSNIDDQILLKSDGFPTYHLASVVDDHIHNISHVIRGEEWLPSVPKHLLLYRYLNWKPPRFAHLPLLLNKDKSKLSKRNIASSLSWFREQGFEKEAILSYIATLGWTPSQFKQNHKEPQEDKPQYVKINDLISQFDLNQVHKSGAIVDINKLYFINSQFLNHLSINETERFVNNVIQILNKHLNFDITKQFSNQYITDVAQITVVSDIFFYFFHYFNSFFK